MTREEAIESLRGILTEAVEFENSVCYVTEEDREPLEMAIKALEHPERNVVAIVPCGDAISRQAALDIVDSYSDSQSNVEDVTQDIISDIVALPPVNLQPCEDAISREATLKPYNGLNDEDTISVWLIRKNIEQQPPVNPQSKTGHWIYIDDIESECSECGHREPNERFIFDDINYCTRCGAKMIDD